MFKQKPLPPRAGAGLKPEHYGDIFDQHPEIGFFEVHAENYMGEGGLPHRALTAIRKDYPVSVHGVGLSIGDERPLDGMHLARLKKVVDRYQPGMVSEHLAWSTHESIFLNDLLPLPYTRDVLARVVEHIDQVQSVLGRPILMENPSTYVAFAESEMSEIDFVREMRARAGCGLLLDVNNVHVSATNQHYDAFDYIDAFPLDHVGEIHLGGHAIDSDDSGEPLLIDAHDREVADEVWQLYAHTLSRAAAVPTLIEWDNDVPSWKVLASEVASADHLLAEARRRTDAA